jgi:hypothetical protein
LQLHWLHLWQKICPIFFGLHSQHALYIIRCISLVHKPSTKCNLGWANGKCLTLKAKPKNKIGWFSIYLTDLALRKQCLIATWHFFAHYIEHMSKYYKFLIASRLIIMNIEIRFKLPCVIISLMHMTKFCSPNIQWFEFHFIYQ